MSSATVRQYQPPVDYRRYLVGAWLTASTVLALFDPGPSRGLALAGRLGFWLLHVGCGFALFALTNRLAVERDLDQRLGPWVTTALSAVVGSVLFAPLSLWFERLMDVSDNRGSPAVELLASYGLPGALLTEFLGVVLPATGLWLALNLPWLLRLDFSITPASSPVDDATDSEGHTADETLQDPRVERFLERLPVAMGRDIVYLSSELQYLKVYTSRGRILILHGLRDAASSLESLGGMQVHRSHWVVRRHVRRMIREGRNMRLEMSQGSTVPVSRKYQPEIRRIFGEKAEYEL